MTHQILCYTTEMMFSLKINDDVSILIQKNLNSFLESPFGHRSDIGSAEPDKVFFQNSFQIFCSSYHSDSTCICLSPTGTFQMRFFGRTTTQLDCVKINFWNVKDI